jgi:excisionase family DNA binding protein
MATPQVETHVQPPTPPADDHSRPSGYHWLSPSEAADRLGVTPRDVYRLIDRGVLAGYRIDGRIRLLAHEVDGVPTPGGEPEP